MKKINKKSTLIIASLIGIFCLGNSASAYSSETYHDDVVDGDTIYYTAACDELDYLIQNGAPDPHFGYVNITLSNDCQKDLVIPSGKKVRLSLKHESGGYRDSVTGDWVTTYEGGTLTNDSGDTITVGNGAVLVLSGNAFNTTSEKTVLNNSGHVFLYGAHLSGAEDGYVIRNSGTLSTTRGTSFNNSRLGNSGTIYVTGGKYLYHDMRQYIVDGCDIAQNDDLPYSDDTVACGKNNINLSNAWFALPEALPDGASITLTSAYPEIANALNYEVLSFDSSTMEVAGNALDGFTLTPKKSGSVWIGIQNFTLGVGRQYSVVYEVENASSSVKDYLANHLSADIIHRIIEAVAAHDKLFMDFDISQLDLENINSTYKNLVNEIIEKATVLGYFDIDYLLKGQSAGNLANIDNLGDDEDDTVDVSVDLPDNLPEVLSGKTRHFFVIRIHEDGTKTIVDRINATEKGGRLHFKSGKFSTYALAYEDVDELSAPNSGINTRSENASAMSDNIGAAVCAFSIAGIMSIVIRKRMA